MTHVAVLALVPEIVATLITVLIGGVSSVVISSLEGRSWVKALKPSRPFSGRAGALGPFTWAWSTAILVGAITSAAVLLAGVPTDADVLEGTYEQFFATAAQITAALIIALAVEASQGQRAEETAFRLEACVCVALAAIAALCGLVPGMPHAVYAVALSIVPPGVIGGLVGVVAIAVGKRHARQPDEQAPGAG